MATLHYQQRHLRLGFATDGVLFYANFFKVQAFFQKTSKVFPKAHKYGLFSCTSMHLA